MGASRSGLHQLHESDSRERLGNAADAEFGGWPSGRALFQVREAESFGVDDFSVDCDRQRQTGRAPRNPFLGLAIGVFFCFRVRCELRNRGCQRLALNWASTREQKPRDQQWYCHALGVLPMIRPACALHRALLPLVSFARASCHIRQKSFSPVFLRDSQALRLTRAEQTRTISASLRRRGTQTTEEQIRTCLPAGKMFQ